MKKSAIVTGASSGIGAAIGQTLCQMGFEVYGFGRDFSKWEAGMMPEAFHPVCCDLLDTERMLLEMQKIKEEKKLQVLVNNAGVGYYGLHEELNVKKIQEMVRVNLELPMILTGFLLRELKKQSGYIIQISSVTAGQSNPHGCAYGATKAGLSSFSASLYDEARKYGVKVVTIQPDMTKTELYRNADFCEGGEEESYLMPQEVAEAVRYALSQREGMVVTNITLRPQIHRIRRKKAKHNG